jgi:branched-chain amino acid transport system substrate-binding protein
MPFSSVRGSSFAALLVGALVLPALTATSVAQSTVTLKIAFQGALTGPVAFNGIPIANGVQLAIAQAHDELLKKGVDLQYAAFDDQIDPAQSAAVARKVIQDKAVIGVVGPMYGVDANPAGSLFTEAHLAMLSMGTAAALTKNNWTFFRAVPNDDLQSAAAGNYLTKILHAKNIALIDDGTQYGHGLVSATRTTIEANGAKVAVAESVDPTSDDYSSTVAKILANKVDGVFMTGVVNVVTSFDRQLGDGGYKGAFFAPDGSISPDFIKLAGAASEGDYFTCQCAPVPEYGGPTTGKLADFVAAYQKKFGVPPQAYSAEAYDVANFMIAGLNAGVRTPADMVKYLHANSFTGVAQVYKYDASGEPEGHTINIYKIEGGKYHWLGTTDTLIK